MNDPPRMLGVLLTTVRRVRAHALVPKRHAVVAVHGSLCESVVDARARLRDGMRVLLITAGTHMPRCVALAWNVPSWHVSDGDTADTVRIVPAHVEGTRSDACVVAWRESLPYTAVLRNATMSRPAWHWNAANACALVDLMHNRALAMALLDVRVWIAPCLDRARHMVVLRCSTRDAHRFACTVMVRCHDATESPVVLHNASDDTEPPSNGWARHAWPRRVVALARALGDPAGVELRAMCSRDDALALRTATDAASALSDDRFARLRVFEVFARGESAHQRSVLSARTMVRVCRAHGVPTVRSVCEDGPHDHTTPTPTLREAISVVVHGRRSLLPQHHSDSHAHAHARRVGTRRGGADAAACWRRSVPCGTPTQQAHGASDGPQRAAWRTRVMRGDEHDPIDWDRAILDFARHVCGDDDDGSGIMLLVATSRDRRALCAQHPHLAHRAGALLVPLATASSGEITMDQNHVADARSTTSRVRARRRARRHTSTIAAVRWRAAE